MKYKFTVFTPCYNSEKLLERLFESLQKQTFKDFEWLVIDDCSTDSTRDLIQKLIKKSDFPVNFIANETNQMVNKNYDIALEAAQGELFIKLSHDDYFIPKALENFNEVWESLTETQRKDFLGVTLHCDLKNGNREGDSFPEDIWIGDDYQMRFRYRIKGEKCSAQSTEKLREYPFHHPGIDTYVPADLHYYRMNNKYKSVYANKSARVHVFDENLHTYLEAQIGRGQKYTKGISFFNEKMVNNFHDKVWKYSKKNYLFFMINFFRYARYNGDGYWSIITRVKKKKLLVPLAIFLANVYELYRFRTLL